MTVQSDIQEIRLSGISASPGICIGKAYLVDTRGVEVLNTYYILESDLKKEKNRFKTAVKKAVSELRDIISDTPKELRQQSSILESHVVLLEDKLLYDKTLGMIESELINAEWALKRVVTDLRAVFNEMEDEYFRERANDIVQVAERIWNNLIGAAPVNISEIKKRVILVANDLSPADTSQIQLEKVMGFITDRGGRTSHTSIIARSLEIPAVQGLNRATTVIKNDDLIVVDGVAGVVIINPTEETLIEFEVRKELYHVQKAQISRQSHLDATTTDGVTFSVMGNIELPEEVVSVLGYGGDGIGLYRTEFQYLSRPGFPTEEELFENYKDVIEVMGDRPVTIRTLDVNGDKALANGKEIAEENPALGLRAIRYCLKKPDVFMTQLRAILRAAAYGKVRILIPMISGMEEIVQVKTMLRNASAELEKEKATYSSDIETGIMIEVPSAVMLAEDMAAEVDFFSIGTNDLIQYSLAIDRGNREVAHMFHPLHPAILKMVKHVADVSRQTGTKLYMCGEMAADPANVPILVGLGIDELSMNPQAIPAVKSMLRFLNTKESRDFTAKALALKTIAEILDLCQTTYGGLLEEHFSVVR
ncbi:MAG: phosphoenolpyruvate--protein phosphotransferase [Desulfobacterales bacterium]|nr:phosphoenolpyruvate--protein phosphotransferase [Desulfobacterales bacterium]